MTRTDHLDTTKCWTKSLCHSCVEFKAK